MRISLKRQAVIYAVGIFFLCLAVSITAINTFSKYVHSNTVTDSAVVAKFDITIIAPGEFDSVSGNNPYQHLFYDGDETISFNFKIINNKEVDVICAPYISNNIGYKVSVSGKSCESFIVKAGDTVSFKMTIMPTGLSEEATLATLIVDIEQI